MNKMMITLKFILLGLIFSSCSSNENSLPSQDGGSPDAGTPERLLRSVKSGDITKTYQYNTDLTLRSITEEWNGEKRDESNFTYSNGKVSEKTWKNTNGTQVRVVYEYNGDLLVKETAFEKNEIITIEEYYYDDNNQMTRQIQKLEWNNEATKQTRVIDIEKVAGKNEIQLKYNGTLSFIITYDDKASPFSKIKGYSTAYIAHNHGITNNILSIKTIYKSGTERTQSHELVFDSSGEYLVEVTKTENNQNLIGKDVYTYN